MWKDSEAEIDYLDYSYLVESINSIIMDDSLLPASIGLYGDWGSGKSTLINMSKSQLEEMNPNTKCLIFNGWLFESYDDTKTAILEEILDIFSHEQSLGEKAKKTLETLWEKVDKIKLGKFALKRGLNFINPATIGIDAFKKLFDILKQDSTLPTDKIFDIKGFREELSGKLNYADLRNDVRGFQKEFESLLKDSNIDRLVVYIDELDRCRPDTILETLEAIKLFLFTGKTAFIIGADQRHIEYAVRTKFKDIEGQEIDIGKEYLEKLIQYPIIIPRLDTSEAETYISCLLLQKRLPKEDFNMAIRKLQEDHDVDFDKGHSSGDGTLDDSVSDVTTDGTGVGEELPDPNQSGSDFDANEPSYSGQPEGTLDVGTTPDGDVFIEYEEPVIETATTYSEPVASNDNAQTQSGSSDVETLVDDMVEEMAAEQTEEEAFVYTK